MTDPRQTIDDLRRRVRELEQRLAGALSASQAEHVAVQQRLQQVIDLVPHFIFAKDGDGRFLLVNEAVARAYGTTTDDLIGRTDADFNPDAEQVRQFRRADLDVIHGGRSVQVPEEVITDAEGNRRWLQTVKIPYSDAATGADAVLGVAVDITEVKKARADRDRLFDLSLDLLSILDADGRIRRVNPAWERVLGWRPPELVGRSLLEFVVREDRRKTFRAFRRLRAGESVRGFESRFRTADGDSRCLEWNSMWLEDERLIVSVTRDISEWHMAERERERLHARLVESQKLESLGLLAGGIAHDFNNLLVGILGNADLALHAVPPDSPARTPLDAVIRTSQRAAELCSQMLAYSGKGRFQVRVLDLNDLVREMAQLLEVSIKKGVRLEIDCAERLPPVEADATQIGQVVLNLITNASDAMPDEGGVIQVRTGCTEGALREAVRAGADATGEILGAPDLDAPARQWVEFEVTDTGCGMDRDTLDRLFDPFFTTKFTGRGLGLSAVLGIVRAHGGEILVRSRVGRGSRFTVRLPASPGAVVDQPAEAGRGAEGDASGAVLVVDDEPIVRELVTVVLERDGFEVLPAESGEEALDVLRLRGDDVRAVLLDLTMPGLGGLETLRRLRLDHPALPVLLSSGFAEEEVHDQLGPLAAAFIQKPYRPSELMAALRAVMA